jgi:hypothetical protein
MKSAVLVVLLAVLFVVPVWSQGSPGGPGGPRHGGPPPGMMALQPPPPAAIIDGLTAMLSLTADQAASLKTVLTAIQPLMKAAGDAGKALRDAIFATDYDSAAIADLATAALTAEGKVLSASIDAWAQIRSILTADQLAKLQQRPGPGGPPPDGSGSSSTSSRRR